RSVEQVFRYVEGGRDENADFQWYIRRIDSAMEHKQPLPEPLVQRMLQQSPEFAMESLAKVYHKHQKVKARDTLDQYHAVHDFLWKLRYGLVEPNPVDPAVIKGL